MTVQFHSANPRHNQRAQGTYLTVERENDGEWEIVRTDGDWDTHFNWICGKDDKLHFGFSHLSRSVVTWDLTQAQQELLRVSSLAQTVVPSLDGQYRICYFGDAMKEISKKIVPFTGCSSTFSVKVK